jgi:hypothetical protein
MIHQSHAAGLLAGLRDGRMTTHFNPVFTVKVLLEPSQTVANCAVTKFCAVPILFDWGKMEGAGPLNGGFRSTVANTPTSQREMLWPSNPPPSAPFLPPLTTVTMRQGFERIEHFLLAEQNREIEDLKQRMKRLEDALAV